MAAETQYTANTGMAVVSTANSNLDGTTGTYVDVITGASGGTLIKTITIKAQGNTTDGMVRLFVYNGTSTKILTEVSVPAITKSATDPTFEAVLHLDYMLKSGGKIKASTQNGESFNIFAEGLDWTYYTTSIRPESTKYAANTGFVTVSTANSNLDGTGTLGTVLTAAYSGTLLQSITLKAQVSTTPGMIRLFLYDGANTRLFTEVPVPAITKSATANSFSHRIDFGGRDYALKTGWLLKASTEKGEAFNVIAEGLDWTYPA
jgi:hypothetical protein